MIVGLVGYVVYRRQPGPGPDPPPQDRAPRAARRSSSSSTTARRSCRSSAPTSTPRPCAPRPSWSARGRMVEAVYVLRVPNQLSLDAGLRRGGAARAERARERQARGPQVRAEGADAADPHPQPGRGDRRGGRARASAEIIYLGDRPRPAVGARARSDRDVPAGAPALPGGDRDRRRSTGARPPLFEAVA